MASSISCFNKGQFSIGYVWKFTFRIRIPKYVLCRSYWLLNVRLETPDWQKIIKKFSIKKMFILHWCRLARILSSSSHRSRTLKWLWSWFSVWLNTQFFREIVMIFHLWSSFHQVIFAREIATRKFKVWSQKFIMGRKNIKSIISKWKWWPKGFGMTFEV